MKLSIPKFDSLEEFITWCQRPEVRTGVEKYPNALSRIASHPEVTPWLAEFTETMQGIQPEGLSPAESLRMLVIPAPRETAYLAEVIKLSKGAVIETAEIEPVDTLPTFGRYRIKRKIAEGGFGAVYEVYDPQLDRIVALKLLKLRTEVEREQFEKEAKLVARLRHPNIIAVHELGVLDRQPYFTMDFIDGKTLRDLLHEKGRLPVREAFRIAATAADALAYAHSNGIVHRDMKPENVFMDTEDRIYVGDFGIAKQVKDARGQVTSSRVVGTPHYMSPEQANGELFDQRSDVWALGIVLYEMLCGICPFEGRAVVNIFKKIWLSDPTPPRKLNSRVSPDANTIVLKCLEKEPDRRYASATELKADIERYLHGDPIEARPIGVIEKLWRRTKRNKIASLGIAAILTAVVVVVLILWSHSAARETELRTRRADAARMLDEARTAFTNHEYEKALELVSKSLTLHSEREEARELKEECARRMEDVKKATDSLVRGVGEIDPARALELIQSTLAILEDDWYAHQQHGLALERCGRVDDALAAFQKAADLAKRQENTANRIESLYRSAIAYWNRQEFESAHRVTEEVKQLAGNRKTVATLTLKAVDEGSDKRYEESLRHAQEAFELDKSNTIALFYKAFALSGLGRHKEAVETYSRCIWEFDRTRNAAWLTWSYNNRGSDRVEIRDFAGAIEDYTQAIQLNPKHIFAFNNRGNVKSDTGDYDGAIEDYNEALRLDPKFAGAYSNRANARLKKGDYDGAISDHNSVLQLRPGDVQALCRRADVKRVKGDYDGAMSDYAKTLQINPNYAAAFHGRALTRRDKGDDSGAMADFNETLRLNPNYASAYFHRASIKAKKGDLDGALADYDEAIRLDPRFPAAYGNRANAKCDKGDLKGALADYNEALRQNPNFPDAYNNRGLLKATVGDHKGALSDYNRAIKLRPNDPESYFNRALLSMNRRNLNATIADYTRVLQLRPDDFVAYGNRGTAKAQSGDTDGAIADFTKALQLNPTYVMALCNRAISRREKGDYGDSVEDARKAARLMPGDSRPLALIAEAYSCKRDKERCLDALRGMLRLDPRMKQWIAANKLFEWLRDDPEFKALTTTD